MDLDTYPSTKYVLKNKENLLNDAIIHLMSYIIWKAGKLENLRL